MCEQHRVTHQLRSLVLLSQSCFLYGQKVFAAVSTESVVEEPAGVCPAAESAGTS